MTEPRTLTPTEVDEIENGWGYIKRYPNGSIRVRDRDMTQDVKNLCATVRALAAKPEPAKPAAKPTKKKPAKKKASSRVDSSNLTEEGGKDD